MEDHLQSENGEKGEKSIISGPIRAVGELESIDACGAAVSFSILDLLSDT